MENGLILLLIFIGTADIIYYLLREQKYKKFNRYWIKPKRWWEFWRFK